MVVASCTHESKTKHGKDRKGNQRWKCRTCNATVTDTSVRRPLGDMRIDLDKAELVIKLLLEGMSIRAAERITGVNRDTICDLVVHVGENCQRFLRETVRNVPAKRIELDEVWGFVACKARTADRRGYEDERGDAWTWIALDADSKLILAHTVGARDESTCEAFMAHVNEATTGECQVTADGLSLYTYNVPLHLGSRASFAQLIKEYSSNGPESRYSPSKIVGARKVTRFGRPDEDLISTSYVERLNLTLRMSNRRMTRLTNAHSKSQRHHAAMMGLFAAHYNFCRKHESLKKQTPAMSSGLAENVWTIKTLLKKAA